MISNVVQHGSYIIFQVFIDITELHNESAICLVKSEPYHPCSRLHRHYFITQYVADCTETHTTLDIYHDMGYRMFEQKILL